jgi:dihydroorotate dehydrogenase (fumarate)
VSLDLSTTYLGLRLAHPLMPGAGPLVDDLDVVRRLEDAGAAAIVMHSLFEEQVVAEELALDRGLEGWDEVHAEATTYLPRGATGFRLGPHEYLEQLRRIKAAVAVPVIGSINGVSEGRWLEYARWVEAAGADALELNTYHMATDPLEVAAAVERRTVDLLRAVKAQVRIPVAVKLAPFYTALPSFARALEEAGADGLVLFNRFYQPDIDVERLEVVPALRLSDPSELPLRVRWLAVLSPLLARTSLACSGGVHGPLDALKAVMAGAHAVQMTSALLQRGPEHLREVLEGLRTWLEEHEYASLAQARGSMSHARCPNPQALERANYVRVLHSWGAVHRPGA